MATPQLSSANEPGQATTIPSVEVDASSPTATTDKKRKFWPFGKKKDDKEKGKNAALSSDYPSQPARSTSPVPAVGAATPTSPARPVNSSPRVASPASSQIFERTVQEESLAPAAVPSTIPNHITTENHIPPALDASTMAITNQKLSPDNVEIFTHVAHTPAAVTVAHGTTNAGSVSGMAPSGVLSEASASPTLPATSEEAVTRRRSIIPPAPHPQGMTAATGTGNEDGASSYGALDSTDVRRLSFISFADVVHGEQAQNVGSEASIGGVGSTSNLQASPGLSSVPIQPLSPALSSTSPVISSPLRASSPARGVSPVRAVSPPTTGLRASSPGLVGSPKIVSSSPSPPAGVQGELAVETMSQALRKTGSGDMGIDRESLASGGSVEGLGLATR